MWWDSIHKIKEHRKRSWRGMLGYLLAIVSGQSFAADTIDRDQPENGNGVKLTQSTVSQTVDPSRIQDEAPVVRGPVDSGLRGGSTNSNRSMRTPLEEANVGEMDLSRKLVPSPSPRSLSQFASANRSSAAFRPTNVFGDFFGGGNGNAKLIIPITYRGLQGPTNISVGNNFIPLSVAGNSNSADLFLTRLPNGTFSVAEPARLSNAFVPSKDDAKGFNFVGGDAIYNTSNDTFDVKYFYEATTASPTNISALYGRQKIAENVSPIPRNRIFVNYSYFDNTPLAGGLDVKRYSPGFESLVWNENTSVEVRLPMATTLSSNMFGDATDRSNYQIGNLYLAVKHLIYRDEQSAISIGCSATLPTANDINVFVRTSNLGMRRLLTIDNESVHLLPFIGWYRGAGRFFSQGFTQLDMDTNGNPVSYNPNFLQDQLITLGRLQDANYAYFDIQNGYWLRQRSPGDRSRGLTGVAGITELHWNRSLNVDDRLVFPNGASFGAPRTNVQILNVLVGMNFVYNYMSSFSVGYATPIGNGSDQDFKGEGRLIYNRYF